MILPHTTRRIPDLHRQSGSVLIIGMLLLLMMTLIGLVSTSETRTDSRITSNNLDRAIAFQAAEAALIQAENSILCYESPGHTSCPADPCDIYDIDNNEFRPKDGTEWDTACESTTGLPGIVEEPSYIIEKLNPTSLFGGYVVRGEVYHGRSDSIYRITVLAYGRSADTEVILQSTFLPPDWN